MNEFDIRPILESLLFVAETPIRLETLIEMLPEFGQEAILKGIAADSNRLRGGFKGDGTG